MIILEEVREDGEYVLSSLSSRKSLAVSRVSNSGKQPLKDRVHRYHVLSAPEGLRGSNLRSRSGQRAAVFCYQFVYAVGFFFKLCVFFFN